jgi:very-short-patch-repair endonuclease
MQTHNLDTWARAHHGLITFEASQLSADAWRRALKAGYLIGVHPRVARLPGTSDTPEQRIAAAVLSAGPGTLASHRSAAYLWGISRPDNDPVDVILRGRNRQPSLGAVRTHRPTDERRLNPLRRSGIACTNILRTLCDLGAVDPGSVSGAVGTALSKRIVTLDALTTTLQQHSAKGRAGVVALRNAIDDWAIDHRPADSVLEQAFDQLVARYRLPPVSFHQLIEGWEVDFRFVDTALVVECDGWSTHGLDQQQFERDRHKDDDLRGTGWIPMRLSYRSIIREPAATARRLRRSLDRWAHVTPPDAAIARS